MEMIVIGISLLVGGVFIGNQTRDETKEILPRYWNAKEHRSTMIECKQMCTVVKLYNSTTGECECGN